MNDNERKDIKKLLDDIDDHLNLILEDVAYLKDKYELELR